MQLGELEKNSEINKRWGSGDGGGVYLVLKSNTFGI